jgi:hypothetical protein
MSDQKCDRESEKETGYQAERECHRTIPPNSSVSRAANVAFDGDIQTLVRYEEDNIEES